MTDSPVSVEDAELDTPTSIQPATDVKNDSKEVTRPNSSEKERTTSEETVKLSNSHSIIDQTNPNPVPPKSNNDVAHRQPNDELDLSNKASAANAAVALPKADSTVSQRNDVTESIKPQTDPDQAPKNAKKRFTFHQVFDKKEKDNQKATNKRERRRTLTFTKSPEASPQVPQEPPEKSNAVSSASAQQPGSQKEDPDSDAIPSHPAVRPPSIRSSSSSAELGRKPKLNTLPVLNTTGPSYSRCACCGKIRRPHAFGTELSPVLENEHLRANFSLEAERTSHESRRYTPIIPIEVADKDDVRSIRTVQGSIEPRYSHSSAASVRSSQFEAETFPRDSSSISVATAQTTIASSVSDTDSQTTAKKRTGTLDEVKLVRFSSLHARRGSDTDVVLANDEEKQEIAQSVPFVPPQLHKPVQQQAAEHRPALLPSQHKLLQQRQSQQHPPAVMSGAAPRAPHPLRQISPIDQVIENPRDQHTASADGGSIVETERQEIKRMPKQDIITVVPLKNRSTDSDASPTNIETSPPTKAQPSTSEPASVLPAAPHKTNKLRKNPSPSGSSISTSRSRRLSLPSPHKFRLSPKRGETIPLPYTSARPGPPPETDPAQRPPLPSQATSNRTSMSSVAEARDRAAAASKASSRRTSTDVAHSNGTDAPMPAGTAGNVDATQTVRPSPSFARFIANLPATHASNVPDAKKFSWGRGGLRRGSVGTAQQGQQHGPPATIAEWDGEGGSVGTRTPVAVGRRSRATSVNGVSEAGADKLPMSPSEMRLPQLQLGGGLVSRSSTMGRLLGDGGKDDGGFMVVSPVETNGRSGGGFVGGIKLEKMMREGVGA
ncbi:uncharacterized protein HMPREF1541_07630 [Cyphellophora europaea CBS 101466]|uniref:Uncharacterized protein n=1 Tax=Cyphellophora europaea (strain CBS 101466) TaxID=1220924 RepID=W2RNG8_CYPE1|nr:uncharacterized protein HMPREF1541_07630 [Cyphellophora europaea CBS 101466]ETN38007.1 hypothetical protein HMPREF1541_07630 [Cyphellophora europaea CBS 101466]